tara:strand:+ start:3024 stop:3200 length:177 start_codon:yes stop_codon:yes gene_type:complete
MEFNAKFYEEVGVKANAMGFFKKWQQLSSSISQTEGFSLCDAGEKAYKQLKLQGSAKH